MKYTSCKIGERTTPFSKELLVHVQPNIQAFKNRRITIHIINCIRSKICKIVNQYYRFLALRYD